MATQPSPTPVFTARVTDRRELARTRHLTVVEEQVEGPGGAIVWEGIERHTPDGKPVCDIVAVFGVTADGLVPVVEQFRPKLGVRVLELPAGLCDAYGESLEDAARREFLEETGYTAGRFVPLPPMPECSGLTNCRLHIFLASNVQQAPGDHDHREGSERILELEIHMLPLADIVCAIFAYAATHPGVLIDHKIVSAAHYYRELAAGNVPRELITGGRP